MKTSKRLILILCILAIFITGCAMAKHRQLVRENLLITGLNMMAFAEEWGNPDSTFVLAGDQVNDWTAKIGWRGVKFEPGPMPYDVWVYRQRGYTLLFRHHALVAWGREGLEEEIEKDKQNIPEASKSWEK